MVFKEQLKLLFLGVLLVVISIVLLYVFNSTGKYIVHPFLYIISFIMGIGWSLTALFSIKEKK